MISRLECLSSLLAKTAAYISAIIMVEMALHILLGIVLRTFFRRSTYVLDEFVTYSVVSITFLCMAYTLQHNKLIRVELFISKASGGWQKGLELFGNIIALLLSCCFVYYFWIKIFWRDFTRQRVSNSIAEVPLWIPEAIALVGFSLFILQLVVIIIKDIGSSIDISDKNPPSAKDFALPRFPGIP